MSATERDGEGACHAHGERDRERARDAASRSLRQWPSLNTSISTNIAPLTSPHQDFVLLMQLEKTKLHSYDITPISRLLYAKLSLIVTGLLFKRICI